MAVTNFDWIDASKRNPEEWRNEDGEFINYLIFSPEFGIDIGNYVRPAKTWVCVGIPCNVTHWMPLPPPPEQ